VPSSGMLQHAAFVRTDVSVGTYHTMLWLLVTANSVSSSQILLTLMMEAIRSSETSVLTRAKWPNIPENGTLNETNVANYSTYFLTFIGSLLINIPLIKIVMF
jgi:hypothetical protein